MVLTDVLFSSLSFFTLPNDLAAHCRAMESDDWSSVIDAQTQSTLSNGSAAAAAAAPPTAAVDEASPSSRPGPAVRVTPFAQARVHRSIGAACASARFE